MQPVSRRDFHKAIASSLAFAWTNSYQEDVIVVTDDSFEEKVLDSELPVLLDIWKPRCGGCTWIAPILEELAKELKQELVIGKLNNDSNPRTVKAYQVKRFPTLLLFMPDKAGGSRKVYVEIQPSFNKDILLKRIKEELSK